MAKISKYIKLDKDILLEYIYNDGNLIGEKYKILLDSRDRNMSYIGDADGITGNNQYNQLFRLDAVSGKWGIVNPEYYSYLQWKDYSPSIPIRHDKLKFHIPINWTFGEHMGFYIRVYTFDSSNTITFDLSNFYFDMTNISHQNLLDYNSPPLLFQEKLWGKNISIEIPAVSEVSSQLTDGIPKNNSINANLTNGLGLSITSPIFIDFHFIEKIQTINGITSFLLGSKLTTTIPQVPEFERLGLMIEHSKNGDYFEIYGTYNDNIAEFKKFIDDSFRSGHRYYVQYQITMYEQNIRGKSTTHTVYDGFNETIDYRPIIKFSTTTAIIDVEMRLIDSVDDSFILRRASYGMLQDEVSKYSLNMTKINLKNANKPKIYNVKNNIDLSLLGKTNSMGKTTVPIGRLFKGLGGKYSTGISGTGFKVGIAVNKGKSQIDTIGFGNGSGNGAGGNGFGNGAGGNGFGNGAGGNGFGTGFGAGDGSGGSGLEQVKVPYPVLMDRFNIIAKSDNSIINSNTFYGYGKIQIVIYPFDNVINFVIAQGSNDQPDYMDLTGFNELKLSFKNDSSSVEFPLFTETNEVNLKNGQVIFKTTQSKFLEIKKIFESGVNLFYIVGSNVANNNSVIYTGLFLIYDNLNNVAKINNEFKDIKPSINTDPKLPKETAIVTKKAITIETQPSKKP